MINNEKINRSFGENFKIFIKGFLAKFGIYKFDSLEKENLKRFKNQNYSKSLCYGCHDEEANVMISRCNHAGLGERCISKICQVSPVCLICNKNIESFYFLDNAYFVNHRFFPEDFKYTNNKKNQNNPNNLKDEIKSNYYYDQDKLDIEMSDYNDESKLFFQ